MQRALNRTISLIVLLFIAFSFSAKGQTATFKKDTVYIFYCYGTLGNGRPVETSIIIKDLTFLKELNQIKDQDKFLCAVFKHSILFIEPSFNRYKDRKLYNFSSNEEAKSFYDKFDNQVGLFNKSFLNFKSSLLANGKRITISVSKIAGEFWIIKTDPNYLYPLSESFEVNCYNYNYLYHLKQIDKIYKLNTEEINTISSVFQPVQKIK